MRTVICGLGVLALLVAGLSVASLHGDTATPRVQAAGTTLGVDVKIDDDSASGLGTIDNCKRVEVGDTFAIDVYITDVTGLQGWELRLNFDSLLLTLTGEDTQYILNGFPLADKESAGQYFFGVAGTAPVSGSGVLVRITFQAVSNGSSALHIRTDAPYAPRLNNDQFSGSVSDAQIAIGQGCDVPTAIPTPSPTPVITPSFPPTSTFTPSPTPSPSPTPTTTAIAETPTETPIGQTPSPTAIGQTPTPTQTATPIGQTPTPTLTPTPTVTPTPAPAILGDGDCNGLIEPPDVLAALKYASKLGPGSVCQGRTDTDCDGVITANDVLRLLRFLAGDALPQPTGCAQIGSPLSA